ncbi:hypothetical protein Drorol1_Dr00005856, partial [Drosera rotundifolia]
MLRPCSRSPISSPAKASPFFPHLFLSLTSPHLLSATLSSSIPLSQPALATPPPSSPPSPSSPPPPNYSSLHCVTSGDFRVAGWLLGLELETVKALALIRCQVNERKVSFSIKDRRDTVEVIFAMKTSTPKGAGIVNKQTICFIDEGSYGEGFWNSPFKLPFSSSAFFISPSPVATASTVVTASTSPLHVFKTISQKISSKLAATNYLIWKMQVLPVHRCHGLLDLVDGTLKRSTRSDHDPDVFAWLRLDQMVVAWVALSLSDSVLPQVIHCSSAH